jgi:hypothetical protein
MTPSTGRRRPRPSSRAASRVNPPVRRIGRRIGPAAQIARTQTDPGVGTGRTAECPAGRRLEIERRASPANAVSKPRPARRRRPHQSRNRRAPVPLPPHDRDPPLPRLPQARRHRAQPTERDAQRRQTAVVAPAAGRRACRGRMTRIAHSRPVTAQRVAPHRLGGQTRATARPMIRSVGTAPKSRESSEFARLSPMTKTVPGLTFTGPK